VAQHTRRYKFVRWMKRLNLLKNVDDRTENGIKQQKIATYVYLILLTGMIAFAPYRFCGEKSKNFP
jgi:hypothetical protein